MSKKKMNKTDMIVCEINKQTKVTINQFYQTFQNGSTLRDGLGMTIRDIVPGSAFAIRFAHSSKTPKQNMNSIIRCSRRVPDAVTDLLSTATNGVNKVICELKSNKEKYQNEHSLVMWDNLNFMLTKLFPASCLNIEVEEDYLSVTYYDAIKYAYEPTYISFRHDDCKYINNNCLSADDLIIGLETILDNIHSVTLDELKETLDKEMYKVRTVAEKTYQDCLAAEKTKNP